MHVENNRLEAMTLPKFPAYPNCNGSAVAVWALILVMVRRGAPRVFFAGAARASRLHSALDTARQLKLPDLLIREVLAAFAFAFVGRRLVFAGHISSTRK